MVVNPPQKINFEINNFEEKIICCYFIFEFSHYFEIQ